MRRTMRILVVGCLATLWTAQAAPDEAASTAPASVPAPPTTAVGWRQNWTGRFPDAQPPLTWSRRPLNSVVRDLTCAATKPADAASAAPAPAGDGFISQWLLLGPLAFDKSENPLAKAFGFDEAAAGPAPGQQVGERAWTALEHKRPDWTGHFSGTMDPPWAPLAKAVGATAEGYVVYAHTYIHSPAGGPVRILVDHNNGLKAFLNGQEVYSAPATRAAFAYWHQYSKYKMMGADPVSPSFEATLAPGWNRLLLKVASAPGGKVCTFALRLADARPLRYEDKNLAWVCPLPDFSNGNPVLVGDRIFVMAEPDELLCINKKDGKVLWTRSNSFYDALTDADRKAHPAIAETIDPLAEKLRAAADEAEKAALRQQIAVELGKIAPDTFGPLWEKMEGHPIGHFAVTGWTTPTPVSDGAHVYVALENGVAACYDLDGNRKWIVRADLNARDEGAKWWPQSYPASPTLLGGKLIVTMGGLQALDPASGKLLWRQPKVGGTAAVIPARAGAVDVVTVTSGSLVRVADGALLYSEKASGVLFSTPVFVDGFVYRNVTDASGMFRCDLGQGQGDPAGESFTPACVRVGDIAPQKHKERGWVDVCVAASPLVHDGLVYVPDYEGRMYVIDFQTRRCVYRQDLTDLKPVLHENAVGCAASPTLGGRYIFQGDNQGNMVLFEPGPQYKQVAHNRLETYVPRKMTAWTAQEVTAYGAPVFEGNRIYIRGERHLYCIGQ